MFRYIFTQMGLVRVAMEKPILMSLFFIPPSAAEELPPDEDLEHPAKRRTRTIDKTQNNLGDIFPFIFSSFGKS
jgi:hypothetical protein